MKFEKRSQFPASVQDLFQYHCSPSALERLLPPRQHVEIARRTQSLEVGQRAELVMFVAGLVRQRWIAEHVAYEPPYLFADKQVAGPFAKWLHHHRFAELDSQTSTLTDEVEYEISAVGPISYLMSGYIRGELESMFAYRHRVTQQDLKLKSALPATPKHLLITGSGGMIGKRVIALALMLGHRVTVLQRVKSQASLENFAYPTQAHDLPIKVSPWHVDSGAVRSADWETVDAVIHLAGANIAGRRWTKAYQQVLRSSRVNATQSLVAYLRQQQAVPATWVTASGLGIYPDSADRWLDEQASPGSDFLGQLAVDWEQASAEVQADGTRWCAARMAMVLDPMAGALVPLLWQYKLLGGGKIGDGKMYWSWIERDDAASALLWLALNPSCTGAYNLSAQPVTNADFGGALSRVLRRPNLMTAPSSVVRLAVGEMADGLLLRSNRADSSKLRESGFPMRYADLESALAHLLV